MGFVDDAMKEFASEWSRLMKLELGTIRSVPRFRASWKKRGRKWTPYNIKKAKSKRAIGTKHLRESIRYTIDGIHVGFKWSEGGNWIIRGRKPKSKMAPPDVMLNWVQTKKLRARDLKTNSFKKTGLNEQKGMAFAMNRNMSYFGRSAFPFHKMAFDQAWEKHQVKIIQAMIKDELNGFND